MRVVAILASHNRRPGTLACLDSFFAQDAPAELAAVVVDDASTDGTADAIRAHFARAEVINANGSLYWAAAMAVAEQHALRRRPDHLLWLNDDVVLERGCLRTLLTASEGQRHRAIVVGALADPATGELTYSGGHRRGDHPLRVEMVAPGAEPVPVDTFNGNLVLVPAWCSSRVGRIDGGFAHAAADLDYGLRAQSLGVPVVLAPGIQGACERSPGPPPWVDERLSLRERVSALLGPKGIPPRSMARYLRRHGGVAWPVFWLAPYLRLIRPVLRPPRRQADPEEAPGASAPSTRIGARGR